MGKSPADYAAVQRHIEYARGFHPTWLSFCDKGIGKWPPEVWEFAELQILDCRLCRFKAIPDDVARLTRLVVLDCKENWLRELPAALTSLPLRALVLNDNKFTAFPEPLLGLADLEVLDLWGNDVREIPSEFFQLPKLRALDLRSNDIKRLPDSFWELVPRLEWILVDPKLPRPSELEEKLDLFSQPATYRPWGDKKRSDWPQMR